MVTGEQKRSKGSEGTQVSRCQDNLLFCFWGDVGGGRGFSKSNKENF